MANHASHAALPYPIKGARFTVKVPFLDADGDPTVQTTPDTEVSLDNAAAADAAEEVSATSGMDGMGMITFTGAETNCSALAANWKCTSGPKATLGTLYPRVLASIGTGTLSAGSVGGGTLGTILAYRLEGCFIKTTGGTGGGGTGGANNQARKMVTYDATAGAFTVEPNWETTPDATTSYTVLLPEGVTLGMITSIPHAPPGAAGLIIAGTGDNQLSTVAGKVNVGKINDVSTSPVTTIKPVLGLAVDGVITTVTNQLTAAQIATGVWQDSTAGDFTAASSIGKALYIANIAPGASGGHFIAGSNAGTTTFGALTVTGAFTAGTNALPWNASWDAEVQSECADALTAYGVANSASLTLIGSQITTAQNDLDVLTGIDGVILATSQPNYAPATAAALALVAADLPTRITKNTALSAFPFQMVDATDHSTAETGVTITATRSLDGAAFAACANSATEIASGWYKIDLAAADLNANTVILRFTGTGCDDTCITIVTEPT